MLIRPTEQELAEFGEPDFIIYNAGQFPANRFTKGMSSSTSVEINFKRMEMVILGTEYAGEMKKGVFSVMVNKLFCVLPSAPTLTLPPNLALPATREVRTAVFALFCQCRCRQRRCHLVLRSLRHWKDYPLYRSPTQAHRRRRARLV